jgi:hypothetical protein
MRILLLMLLAAAPAAVSAQEMMFSQNLYNYFARPNRDRVERFQSARAEALQMSIAMDDPSDQLTLENWGDNRADLKPAATSLTPDLSYTSADAYSGASKTSVTGGMAGVYGRASSFEYEGSYDYQNNDPGPRKDHEYGGGFGYGHDFGGFSGGLHATAGQISSKSATETISQQNTAGLAAAFGGESLRLGLTADYLGRGSNNTAAKDDEPYNGPSFGAQAIIAPEKDFKLGLRASYAPMKGDYSVSGKQYTVTSGDTELGARAELKRGGLTLAAEVSNFRTAPAYTYSGTDHKDQTDNFMATVGAGLRLLEDKLLLGAEVKSLNQDDRSTSGASVSHFTDGWTIFTGGAELKLSRSLALRGSYSASQDTAEAGGNKTKTKYDSFAAGLGYRSGDLGIDLTLRRFRMDLDAKKPDVYDLVKLMASFRL